MPLPKPRPNEVRDKFIARCMADPTVKRDFTQPKQRLAVCFSQFTAKEGLFKVGGIIVMEAFFSLGDKLRDAIQDKWGRNTWLRDFSNKEAIMANDDWGPGEMKKVGYKIRKGEIVFDGAPMSVELVKRYESQLTVRDLVDLAEMELEVKDAS